MKGLLFEEVTDTFISNELKKIECGQHFVECPPQARTVFFQMENGKKFRYYLHFPYSYFLVRWRQWMDGYICRFRDLHVYFSETPIHFNTDWVYQLPLGNVLDGTGETCVGKIGDTSSPKLLTKNVINAFWQRAFTEDYGNIDTRVLDCWQKQWTKNYKSKDFDKLMESIGRIGDQEPLKNRKTFRENG